MHSTLTTLLLNIHTVEENVLGENGIKTEIIVESWSGGSVITTHTFTEN